jgi:hypothetical protein
VKDRDPARTKRDPGHTVQQSVCDRRRAGGTTNDRNARRPAKRFEIGRDGCETRRTHNIAGLQQSLTASLDQVDTGHSLTAKPFCRLRGARGKHYIAGLNDSVVSGLNVLDPRKPTCSGPLGGNCPVILENTAVRRGGNHLIHCSPDYSQKLCRATQGHGTISRFHELFRNRMVPEGCKLTIGWPCKAIGEGETGTVGVNAPMADGSGTDGASLLNYGDAYF